MDLFETKYTDTLLPSPRSSQREAMSLAAEEAIPLCLNDIHSQMNPTRCRRLIVPCSITQLQQAIRDARASGQNISVFGGRHAMGGQQFGDDAVQIDMSALNRVISFNPEHGLIEVEAGIQWPELIAFTTSTQRGAISQVGIAQKQTGADRLSLGGALAANIHGRGLQMRPIISDVESFDLIDAEGQRQHCSRSQNSDLFRLCIGGYGLLGIIASVRLRLVPRRKLERVVEIIEIGDLPQLFARRIREGYLYGDCQYVTDLSSEEGLRRGIFSCYRPISVDTPILEEQRELSLADWGELLFLAHTDRARAFALYAQHYLSTNGQVYWSDEHQLSVYLDDYHRALDERCDARFRGSEMITECYVPRATLAPFMETVRGDFLRFKADLIYGTIRLIEKDEESFLAWAKDDYACVIFNLHVEHSDAGIAKAQADFRRLIDRAVEFGGSYYLTYHRWAERRQVEACYPQLPEFLRRKIEYDPAELFQSDWYRHYKQMFANRL